MRRKSEGWLPRIRFPPCAKLETLMPLLFGWCAKSETPASASAQAVSGRCLTFSNSHRAMGMPPESSLSKTSWHSRPAVGLAQARRAARRWLLPCCRGKAFRESERGLRWAETFKMCAVLETGGALYRIHPCAKLETNIWSQRFVLA